MDRNNIDSYTAFNPQSALKSAGMGKISRRYNKEKKIDYLGYTKIEYLGLTKWEYKDYKRMIELDYS